MKDSTWLIGNVQERFAELSPGHPEIEWRSFYQGWIEGRAKLISPRLKWQELEYDCVKYYYAKTRIAEYVIMQLEDGFSWEYSHTCADEQEQCDLGSLEAAMSKAQKHFEDLLTNPI